MLADNLKEVFYPLATRYAPSLCLAQMEDLKDTKIQPLPKSFLKVTLQKGNYENPVCIDNF